MPTDLEVFADAGELGARAARLIADGIVAARGAGRTYVLGCPGGRSAASTYAALAHLVRRERITLDHLVVVMMDDYLVRDQQGVLVHELPDAPHSCIRFGRERIARPLSEAAGPGRGLLAEHLWFPDPGDPADYDRRITDLGGIDVFLLASGSSDGHVAFNPAGATRDCVTRVVELTDSTRRDNLATFPSFEGRLERVPEHGVTVGIDTIVSRSASVIMIAHGHEKRAAAARLLAARGYEESWPATVFAACARPRLFLDVAALSAAAPVPTR